MQKILVSLLLGFFCNAIALDSISSMPTEQKNVIDSVIKALNLPSNESTKKIIYDKLNDFFVQNWSAHWTTNSTGSTTKIKNSDTQICDVTIYNNNRAVNCTFVYFKNEKQLFVTLKQYVESDSNTVMKIYNEAKSNPKYEIQNETDIIMPILKKKAICSIDTFHIKSPTGMVIYESSYFFDIK
ncbi:hypothetical protein FA592_06435 [Sulfurospirillum diekertiae]|uniref:hypothetical protein n=1 Tax=Sulfurospirillum diekertiae TaxID=1854492 RepID=UPI00142793CF|nr:hypothetical protein [Sulfurospirillum diekertiae]QIR78528.1 hypothetical protein FA592_06435 [Sulfurospirillum diekertiae]